MHVHSIVILMQILNSFLDMQTRIDPSKIDSTFINNLINSIFFTSFLLLPYACTKIM
jgi:hypothetical protein